MNIDLHMHSNVSSDGDYSPAELMTLCSNACLKVVALTDHNSVSGIHEAVKYGNRLGLEVIPGIELDCTYDNYTLHLLGYGIDPDDKRFVDIENRVKVQERAASAVMMENVRSVGIFFDETAVMSLAKDGIVTGEMIGEVALEDPRNDTNVSLQAYRNDGNRSVNPYVNFYWDFCSTGKPGHVPIDYIHLSKGIELIIDSGGSPVLAHPQNNIGINEQVFANIVSSGIKGVEVYNSYHDKEGIMHYEQMAKKYSLIATAGSDFHGKTKPSVVLGGHGYKGIKYDIPKLLEVLI